MCTARSCDISAPAPPDALAARGDEPTNPLVAPPPAVDAPRRGAAEAPTAVPLEPWLDHPYELELTMLVVDPLGMPRQNVTPTLAARDLPLNLASVRTGVDGRAVVRWRSRSPSADVVVCDDHGALRLITVRHGTCSRLCAGGTSHSIGDCQVMQSGLHPFAVFTGDTPIVPRLLDEQDGAVGILGFDGHYGIAPRAMGRNVRTIEGTVFAEDGSPANGEWVCLFGSGPKQVANTRSDETGRFVFDGLEPDTYMVRAGGDRAGLGTNTAVVTNGITPTRVDLRRDSCIRGRVVRSDAAPAVAYRVAFVADDGSWSDETSTGADGSFVVANLTARMGAVFAWGSAPNTPPVAFALHTMADNGELVLRHDVAHERRILLDAVVPEDCRDTVVELRVWSTDSGVGVMVPRPEGQERWSIGPLPPGGYRIALRAPGCGFVALTPQFVDGVDDIDLGRVVLPRPGRVKFVIPDAIVPADQSRRANELYEVRADADVRIPLDDFPRDRPVYLPAGNYAFAFRHRDGGVRFVRFTVRAGEETVVTAQ